MTKDAASERSQTAASATSSRGAHSADRLFANHLHLFLGVSGEIGLENRGLDEARAHGVHPDSALGVFEGRILRKTDDAMLAGYEGGRTGECRRGWRPMRC